MNPQVSPDGRYMVALAADSIYGKQAARQEQILIDLTSNTEITKTEGSNRVFWSDSSLLVFDSARMVLLEYDLQGDVGKKKKEISVGAPIGEVSIKNGVLTAKKYVFKHNKITQESLEINI